MLDQKQESWKTALKYALTVIWTILGLAAPAPVLPYAMYPEMGALLGIVFGVVATLLWLLPAYLVFWKGK